VASTNVCYVLEYCALCWTQCMTRALGAQQDLFCDLDLVHSPSSKHSCRRGAAPRHVLCVAVCVL
jgi:hypothetical protein